MITMAKSKKKASTAPKSSPKANKLEIDFPLGKKNYMLMAIGFVIIIIGFILMAGKENIYGFTKTTLSVIFIMFGYAFEVYAIMKRFDEDKTPEEQANS